MSADAAPGMQRCIRCRKCRMVLAHNNDIQDHEPGNGQTAFAYRKREGLLQQQQIECANIFIEPLSWIEGKENDTSNKIVCPNPKCGAKLGGYNWSGDQCSCGAWIAPAFSIHKNKVDILRIPVASESSKAAVS